VIDNFSGVVGHAERKSGRIWKTKGMKRGRAEGSKLGVVSKYLAIGRKQKEGLLSVRKQKEWGSEG